MSDQTPNAGGHPLAANAASSPYSSAPNARVRSDLGAWMVFVGVMTIIYGVFQILSCFGLPAGVLAIIAGAALIGARRGIEGVEEVPPHLGLFFDKLRTFMVMLGWAYIISIALTVLLLLAYFLFFAGLFSVAALSGN